METPPGREGVPPYPVTDGQGPLGEPAPTLPTGETGDLLGEEGPGLTHRLEDRWEAEMKWCILKQLCAFSLVPLANQ